MQVRHRLHILAAGLVTACAGTVVWWTCTTPYPPPQDRQGAPTLAVPRPPSATTTAHEADAAIEIDAAAAPATQAPVIDVPHLPAPPPPPSSDDETTLLHIIDNLPRETDPVRHHERLVTVCLRWAAFDPRGALSLTTDLSLDPLDGNLVPNIVQQWAGRDFPSAQAWATNLGPGALADAVWSGLAYVKAQSDPLAASHLLERIRGAGSVRDEATLSVLTAWAARDMAGATAWARSLPVAVQGRAQIELAGIAAYAPPKLSP